VLGALGLAGVGVGVLLVWSSVANVSPVDVVRSVFDPSTTRGAIDGTPGSSSGAQPGPAGEPVGSDAVALTNVRGIVVASSIAGQVGALLDHAERDGIRLGGSGWRSNKRQREMYAQNCPGGKCKVPTAVPGTSMHEVGLAIDFTQGGRSLTSSSSGFRWLARNAARYGLKNLPSEPWHWSTNGR